MRIDRGVTLTLPDGCQLVADIYRPDTQQRVPAVLERTPYDRGRCNQAEIPPGGDVPRSREEMAEAFVARGYALVVQDCRGTGQSTGEFEKYVNEAVDGLHTQAWLAAQPWCDGRVATVGFSYSALTQLATACLGAPHLRAMFLDSGGFFDAHSSGIRFGGAFELKQATWSWMHAQRTALMRGDTELAARIASEDLRAWLRRTPWTAGRSPIAGQPEQERVLAANWAQESFSDFWRQPFLHARGAIDRIRQVPAFLFTSWFDTSLQSTVQLWEALHKAGQAAPLVIGPWTHGNRHQRFAGERDFGPSAVVPHASADFLRMRLDWFDQVLGGAAPARETARVRYFVMGATGGDANCWREASHWPPPASRPLVLHLLDGGTLAAQPGPADTTVLRADPTQPVPTRGGAINSGEPLMDGGSYAHEPTMQDVLVFESQPLQAPVEIAGPVSARLYVATDGPDADLCIKLLDVHPASAGAPHGVAYNLTDGVLRLSHRDPQAAPRAARPGEVMQVQVNAYPTAHRFEVGHRIRLDIAGSNFPRFDLNPNADPLRRHMDHARTAHTTVHLGGDCPSCLELLVTAAPA